MTQAWQGKSKGNKLGYMIFVGTLRLAGVRPAYFLLRFVSLYYVLFSYSSTKHIYRYFHNKLGYGFWRSMRSVYANYYVFGQTLIDKVVVMSELPVKYTFDFDGEDYLREISAIGKGGILISAHLGNWELAGNFFKRLDTRVNIVMFDREHQQIKQYLNSVMSDKKLNIIPLKDDMSHIYEINNALKRNEMVCLHGDRFVQGNKTIRKQFLGEEADFPLGPFILAVTFKVPVSYVFSFKDSAKHYHLYASPPKEYTGPKQEAIDNALNDFIEQLEAKVKLYPRQWFNYYDFWAKQNETSPTQ